MNEIEFKSGVIRPVECYKEAWEIIKDQYWLIFAVTIVGMIIGGAVPVVLIGPMMCGIYLVLFSKFEGKKIEFGELFKGFEFFLPSLVLSVIIVVPVFIMMIGVYVPMIAMALAGPRMSEGEMFTFIAATLAVELVFAVLMVCLHTLLMFAFPLLVDKKLSATKAIKTSAKAVWKNLSGVVGLFAVGFVLAILGYLVFCVGIYLVFPVMIAANVAAYRKIFPATRQNFNPPTPDFYQGI
jgi:uncharacterized membrane protein